MELAAILAVLAALAAPQTVPAQTFKTHTHKGYPCYLNDDATSCYFVSIGYLPWREVYKFCIVTLGGSMVAATNNKTMELLVKLMQTEYKEYIWMGGKRGQQDFAWILPDNKETILSLNDEYWGPGEPSARGDCVRLERFSRGHYGLSTWPCTQEQHYMCAIYFENTSPTSILREDGRRVTSTSVPYISTQTPELSSQVSSQVVVPNSVTDVASVPSSSSPRAQSSISDHVTPNQVTRTTEYVVNANNNKGLSISVIAVIIGITGVTLAAIGVSVLIYLRIKRRRTNQNGCRAPKFPPCGAGEKNQDLRLEFEFCCWCLCGNRREHETCGSTCSCSPRKRLRTIFKLDALPKMFRKHDYPEMNFNSWSIPAAPQTLERT